MNIIKNLWTNYNLQDVWRSQHPRTSQYTWRNNLLKVQCRLDYSLVSTELSALVTDSRIVISTISHHSEIPFHLQSKEYVQRGRGFWKIYNSLLSDERFTKIFWVRYPSLKQSTIIWMTKASTGIWLKCRGEVSVFSIQNGKTGNAEIPKGTSNNKLIIWWTS